MSWHSSMAVRKTGRGTSEHEDGGELPDEEPLLYGGAEDHGQGTDAAFRGLPPAEGVCVHQQLGQPGAWRLLEVVY